jgi:hypothetical protein
MLNAREPARFKLLQPVGLFAQLRDCVLLSKACAERHLEPYFFLHSPISYQNGLGLNALAYYFEQRNLSGLQQLDCYRQVLEGNFLAIRDKGDINRLFRGGPSGPHHEISNELTTLEEGRRLFSRNLRLRHWVIKYAHKLWAPLSRSRILGIHYRGKDHFGMECDVIPFDHVIAAAQKALSKEFAHIVLATDEVSFYQACQAEFGEARVTTYHPPLTSLFHDQDTDRNFKKNAMALADSILLSKCDLLIKTPSSLSAWSKIFNPALNVVCVGRPYHGPWDEPWLVGYGYWPEKCLHPMT